jgi:hypothetical protein
MHSCLLHLTPSLPSHVRYPPATDKVHRMHICRAARKRECKAAATRSNCNGTPAKRTSSISADDHAWFLQQQQQQQQQRQQCKGEGGERALEGEEGERFKAIQEAVQVRTSRCMIVLVCCVWAAW